MLNIAEIYWAAGFLEGEGYFKKKKTLVVSANQIYIEPLERLQKIFRGKIYNWLYKDKIIYGWYVSGPLAASIMMTLYSLMSVIRQEQIKQSLEFWKLRRFKRNNNV